MSKQDQTLPDKTTHFPSADETARGGGEIEISILDILSFLWRSRRPIAIATLTLGIAAFLVATLLPKSYTAVTSFLPPQQGGSMSSALMSQLGGLGSLAGLGGGGLPGLKNPADLYIGLLKSQTVENSMVKRFDLVKEYKAKRLSAARAALEGHTTIDGSGKDGLIRVSVQARSPERAAELANGYIDQYRALSASLAIGEASQRRLFLEQQLKETKNNLAAAEEQLKQTEQTSGLIQLDSQARALVESAGALRAQIGAKEVQVQSMRTYAGTGNVDLLQAEQELAGLRAQLAKLGGGNAENGELLVGKGKLPQAGLEYLRKSREVKYNETLFEILARQYEAARLDEAKEGALIQVVDRAYPPDMKSWPPRLLFTLGGAFLGFLAASLTLLVRAAARRLRPAPPLLADRNAWALPVERQPAAEQPYSVSGR